ncbi:MAG: metalloregulator ArsR/SmtB family transcription factor [Chloroflexota bacterium]
MTQTRTTDTAPIFAALGDETRLRLVARLSADGPQSITRLTAGGSMTRQAVTKHLHVLADAGIAHSRQRGRERIWELDREALLEARAYLDQVSARWDVVLGRLKEFVELHDGPASSTETP